MAKEFYKIMGEIEDSINEMKSIGDAMKQTRKKYEEDMAMYDDRVRTLKSHINIRGNVFMTIDLKDVVAATAEEWGISPEEITVCYDTAWDQVMGFCNANLYEAKKSADKFNKEKEQMDDLLFRYSLEQKKDGSTVRVKKIYMKMLLHAFQKDNVNFADHLQAHVYASDRVIVKKVEIDDINKIYFHCQVKDMVTIDNNQVVPKDEIAMMLFDCAEKFEREQGPQFYGK